MNKGFNYENVIGSMYEGWLNLFHNDDIVCVVRAVAIAEDIRKTTPLRIKNAA